MVTVLCFAKLGKWPSRTVAGVHKREQECFLCVDRVSFHLLPDHIASIVFHS